MIEITKLTGRMGNQMFQHAYLYAQARKGITSDVYVQDPKFFEEYTEEIKVLYGAGIGYDDRVGIQLRRGDYVGNPFYVNLSTTEYYKKAIAMFPNDKFLVFCKNGDPVQDKMDRQWCIEYFDKLIPGRFDFCDIEEPVDAFNAFASCKHTIMANGSFSWWAAFLNKNPDKVVIAPRNWYSDGIERTKCPPEWIKL